MIRPITAVCALLAFGSGLYLYQSKHQVQVIEKQIEKTVHETDALRDRTRVLRAEWTLLSDPDRLRVFADQYLALKTVTPGQFTSLADLDTRLPAPRPPEAQPATPRPQESPVALPTSAAEETARAPAADVAATEVLPLPPLPVPPPAPVQQAAALPPSVRVAERKALPPRPPATVTETPAQRAPLPEQRAAEAHYTDQRPVEPRVQMAAPAPRPVPFQRHEPVAYAPAPAQQMPAAGSLLGMAHGAPPAPVPLPTPINATQWVNRN